MVAGEVEARENDSPIAFAAAVLLSFVRVRVGVASFGEEPRKVLFGCSRTVGKAGVVTVSVLVGASHYLEVSMRSPRLMQRLAMTP